VYKQWDRLSENCGDEGLSTDHYLLGPEASSPHCQELCVAVDVKDLCFPGYIDAAAKQDWCG